MENKLKNREGKHIIIRYDGIVQSLLTINQRRNIMKVSEVAKLFIDYHRMNSKKNPAEL